MTLTFAVQNLIRPSWPAANSIRIKRASSGFEDYVRTFVVVELRSWPFFGLEEELDDFEEQSTAKDEGENDYQRISISSSGLFQPQRDVLIHVLLIGLFWGPRGLTT